MRPYHAAAECNGHSIRCTDRHGPNNEHENTSNNRQPIKAFQRVRQHCTTPCLGDIARGHRTVLLSFGRRSLGVAAWKSALTVLTMIDYYLH